MPIDYSFQQEGSTLLVTASSNEFTYEEALGYIQAVGEAALRTQCSHILCDETNLTHRLGLAETFELAEYSANLAKQGNIRVVLLCHESVSQAIQLYENATVNRGMNLKITTSREEANEWLFGSAS